jgi:hypothetical protein
MFDGPGKDAADKRIQHSIANLVKRRLAGLKCECKYSNLVVTIGGDWRTGEFKVKELTGCCLNSASIAHDTLSGVAEKKVNIPSFTRVAIAHAANARAEASGLFSLQ